jgi:hypothetical protein
LRFVKVVGPLYDWLINTYDKKYALGWTLAISGITCVASVLCSIVRDPTTGLPDFFGPNMPNWEKYNK